MTNRTTPGNIIIIPKWHTVVVPTNQAGKHGRGLARFAYRWWGIAWGKGEGESGNCYLLPTKDALIKTLPLDRIAEGVACFLAFAKSKPLTIFWVPEIGCGLARLIPQQIAPLFKGAVELENVHLPASFWAVLNKSTL